jgi:hypothetical protein
MGRRLGPSAAFRHPFECFQNRPALECVTRVGPRTSVERRRGYYGQRAEAEQPGGEEAKDCQGSCVAAGVTDPAETTKATSIEGPGQMSASLRHLKGTT